MRRIPLVLLLALASCGDDPRLAADPREIKADGSSTSRITFYDDQDDGGSIYFETDQGTFRDADGYETTYVTRSIAGGQASVDLYSSTRPGTATVTASDDFGASVTVTVTFLAMRPSGGSLSFECDSVNLGALRDPLPDLAAACRLSLRDATGAAIDPQGLEPGAFGFMAEAGTVDPTPRDDYGDIYFLYTTASGISAEPVDVDPIDGEPSRPGDVGGTRNPRDGLVTIVAWVRGEEGFHDVVVNGIYEPENGETFTDLGEPFVDVDDDGALDAGAGDIWIDLDGNARYTEPNGVWDEDTLIWTTFKVLWTGPVHQSPDTSRIDLEGGRDVAPGATREVTVTVVDENINPIAANGASGYDTVVIYPGCSSCSYPSDTDFELLRTRGFTLDSRGMVEGNVFSTPQYALTVTNANTYAEPEPFTITVSGDSTPAPLTADLGTPDGYHFDLPGLEARLMGSGE
jgi:hypothetical protein